MRAQGDSRGEMEGQVSCAETHRAGVSTQSDSLSDMEGQVSGVQTHRARREHSERQPIKIEGTDYQA